MGSARAGPGTLVPRPGSATRVRGADVVVREDRRARGAVNPAAPETPVGPGSSSWEAIVVEHSARVYRLAYRLTGNQHDAEDLTQEVFVRVFRSLSTYTPGTFEGWLHRITVNLFLDQMRRRQRIRIDAIGSDAESPPSESERWSYSSSVLIASIRMRCRRRIWSRKRLTVIRC